MFRSFYVVNVFVMLTILSGCNFSSNNESSINSVAEAAIVRKLIASNITENSVDLSWKDMNREKAYIVERSLNGSSYSQIKQLPANQNFYKDVGLNSNTTYYYRVRFINTKNIG